MHKSRILSFWPSSNTVQAEQKQRVITDSVSLGCLKKKLLMFGKFFRELCYKYNKLMVESKFLTLILWLQGAPGD